MEQALTRVRDSQETPAAMTPPSPPRWWAGRAARRALLVAVVVASSGATVAAMLRTSTTFDEITAVAIGVRGYSTGRWDLASDFPPVMEYLYALPVELGGVKVPAEVGTLPPHRYAYAQNLYFKSGNDPERLALLSRLLAVAVSALLVLLSYTYVRSRYGAWAGLLAATLTAFLPDVLAHGGIAYNDLPLAASYLGALWALDVAARRPAVRSGAIAGALVGLTVAVKFSGIVLVPAGLLLLVLEGFTRKDWRDWLLPRVLLAAVAATLAGYVALALCYRGDFALTDLRANLLAISNRVTIGQPAYLIGRFHAETPWYFFPVAFFFKTPAGLHLLMLLAVLGYARAGRPGLMQILSSPLRAPVVGIAALAYALVQSNLSIGFRYALPTLPLICVLTAVGLVRLFRVATPLLRAAVVALLLWFAGSSLAFYPDFIAYTSEYGPGRDLGWLVFNDSSYDWGQGLLELRKFMREEKIPDVYLSYFGSALPFGYGIHYLPLPSFFPLSVPHPAPGAKTPPKYVVISGTNLTSEYFSKDVFAPFRRGRPYRVLGHSLFVYRLGE